MIRESEGARSDTQVGAYDYCYRLTCIGNIRIVVFEVLFEVQMIFSN